MARLPTVALLYPGDRATRDRSDPAESRFAALFEAYAAAGVNAEPAIYHDDFADEVAEQLRRVKLVLVWNNPIEAGRRRDRLDAMLRDVAAAGVQVSTHPDTIAKLGTKDVLLGVRDLPFGSDVYRVDSLAQLERELPQRLEEGPRVLKQYRGHSGIGIWRVEAVAGSPLCKVRHAHRGGDEELLGMTELLQRLAPYFEPEAGGHMIDQVWQPRIADGMVRAYLVQDRVGGFGYQAINALHPTHTAPGPRVYYPADFPRFGALKGLLEGGWIDQLRLATSVTHDRLPMLWDCDFMFGEQADSFMLCEINVSSVSPFPPSAIEPLVGAVKKFLDLAPTPSPHGGI
ncbi:Cj0069 family protein [Roseateles microcysteis]|uniref:Cj0069 family protein n=1 Tax=Roseateles microcysteis TaxID=3119057 RepID=UPI002FE53CCB